MSYGFRTRFITATITSLAIVASVVSGTQAQGMVRDNSDNSIVRGGTLTAQEFTVKATANDPNDLQAVYASYGLSVSEYDDFRQNSKMGTAHKNGEITVDGRVVAKDTRSLGRSSKSYATARTINGKTYYESRNQDVFASETIPVIVYFDDQGRFVMGVLTACGNPIRGTATTPAMNRTGSTTTTRPDTQPSRCEMLERREVTGQANTYDFTVRATAAGGGNIDRVVYEFSDGTAQVTRTSISDPVRHTFRTTGTQTVRATVYVRNADGTTSPATGTSCTMTITVRAPAETTDTPSPGNIRCRNLRVVRSTASTNPLDYVITVTAEREVNGLFYADINYGDGMITRNLAAPAVDATELTRRHTYPGAGPYTVRVTLFDYPRPEAGSTSTSNSASNSNSNSTTGTTTTTGTVSTTVSDEDDGTTDVTTSDSVTVGSSATCTVQLNIPSAPVATTAGTTTPTAPAAPAAPATLPETGVGEFIALFTAVSLIGSTGYYLYTKRRLAQL